MLCDEPQDVFEPGNNRLGVEEIFKGIHPALLKLVEWNRQIAAFTSLTIDDQAKLKLTQASWCEHYTLKVVNQLDLETDAVCRCGGKTCVQGVLHREINQWCHLQINRAETACLKAIIPFNLGIHFFVLVSQSQSSCSTS